MTMSYTQLTNLNSSLTDELSEIYEALARSEYNELMLTSTIRALQVDAVKTVDKVDFLQNKLDRRMLNWNTFG